VCRCTARAYTVTLTRRRTTLGLLLEEAAFGRVSTVIVQDLSRFGCYEVRMHALMAFERGGADVVVASNLLHDDGSHSD
jgi:hypothetical protein